MRQIDFDYKELLSSIVKFFTSAIILSNGGSLEEAELLGSLPSSFVKTIHCEKSISDKFNKLIIKSVSEALQNYELPDDCRNELEQNLISIDNLNEYYVSATPDEFLEKKILEICKNSKNCDINTLPILDIICDIIKALQNNIINSPESIWVATYKMVGQTNKTVNTLLECIKEQSIFIKNSKHNPIKASNMSLKEILWENSKSRYLDSHSKGNRFHTLKIFHNLLPHGYTLEPNFITRGKIDNGEPFPLLDLCFKNNDNISIIGEGGIGKTTFLQLLMQDAFVNEDGSSKKYLPNSIVPFFIELNRCPKHIATWYDDSLRKTNFITRYIGQMKENHGYLDSVSKETLVEIEKELQKHPSNNQPEYLLLLDGFNEVVANKDIRTYLSNEISVLCSYPNLRIITTSRKTQSAYYTTNFTNIQLTGLMENEIVTHLKKCNFTETIIGNALANKSLLKCLKIPLYLCMFSSSELSDNILPETAGEILFFFFYKNSIFYNTQKRISEMQMNPKEKQKIVFILNFILPYIGWSFENKNTFSMNRDEFETTISNAMFAINKLFIESSKNHFSDYEYSNTELKNVFDSFYISEKLDTKNIISCINDTLSIIYQYNAPEKPICERIQYSFWHHHLRDFFSSIWDVQLLFMLQFITPRFFSSKHKESSIVLSYNNFLNQHYWNTQKVEFISQILMEHRNAPQRNSNGDWFIPSPQFDQQEVLSKSLDFCRDLKKSKIPTRYLLQNILSAISLGRKDFAGLNLSNLNLEGISLFNINCSKKGDNGFLTTNFNKSILYENNFITENHHNQIIEYIYHNNHCYTMDYDGVIKCWDIKANKQEYELNAKHPLGIFDFSTKGYMKISNDGKWLITRIQHCFENTRITLIFFNLNTTQKKEKTFNLLHEHKELSFLGFTEDSQSLIILCDKNFLYCFNIATSKLNYNCRLELLAQSEVFAKTETSPVYIVTYEYYNFMMGDEEADIKIENDFYVDSPVNCEIKSFNPFDSNEQTIHEFLGSPCTQPTVAYIPEKHTFLFYNDSTKKIEKFDCNTNKVSALSLDIPELKLVPPDYIHFNKETKDSFFIMYPDVCYNIDLEKNITLIKYRAKDIGKLIEFSESSEELSFVTNVAPTKNNFILSNDANTYEYDVENESLYLKYNCAYFESVNFYLDQQLDLYILVHRNNGVSIFDKKKFKLLNQICFYEPDYFIGNSCYDKNNSVLALTFSKPEHEKVVLLQIQNENVEQIFSSLHKNESIVSLDFSNDGHFLLISSQYQCAEYDLINKVSSTVIVANQNERIAAANYVDNDIEIVIVEDSNSSLPRIIPRCNYFKRKSKHINEYILSWYYLLPRLDKNFSEYFISERNDLGYPCSNDANGIQTYWVTRGFFLKNAKPISNILSLECYERCNNEFKKIKKSFSALDMIYFCHNFTLSNHSIALSNKEQKKDVIKYNYLSKDKKSGIFVRNDEDVTYQSDLPNLTHQKLLEDFNSNSYNEYNTNYYDFILPWKQNMLIGCFESSNFHIFSLSDIEIKETFSFNPGIAICECSFSSAKCSANVKKIIQNNT